MLKMAVIDPLCHAWSHFPDLLFMIWHTINFTFLEHVRLVV